MSEDSALGTGLVEAGHGQRNVKFIIVCLVFFCKKQSYFVGGSFLCDLTLTKNRETKRESDFLVS